MSATFGKNIKITLFGQSHGEAVGAVLDGIKPGIKIDTEFISSQLKKRQPIRPGTTQRHENDRFKIVSGVFNGFTTGAPICILIENCDTDSSFYEETRFIPRPSHADYTSHVKYGGFEDYRGGGAFSGRLTAPLVAAGAIAIQCLEEKGIGIGTHVLRCMNIYDRGFSDTESDIHNLNLTGDIFLDKEKENEILSLVRKAHGDGDSLGAVLETAVTGVSAGLGEPWFDSAESVISHMLFSVPGIKGVQFGDGFALSELTGSQANDCFYAENGKILTKTNRSGGINGGITNGMPIVFSCVMRPAPSVKKEQDTVNIETKENVRLKIRGRHDSAVFLRAPVIINSVTALALLDLMS